ncbi:hypothetical protein BD560DRAFT_392054 [Blakeslea trispora]|nr:hypothetical protein BD560DRAFT_392054 [Blakeslea trispora]
MSNLDLFLQRSKRTSSVIGTNTQVSSRSDIFEREEVDEQEIKEEARRMDLLMQKLLGGQEEQGEEEADEETDMMQEDNGSEQPDEEFAFRLFSSQPVAKVTLADAKDDTDSLSKAISEQQQYEFDETEPEFVARIKQVAVDYTTIMEQSTVPYQTAVHSRRLIHLPTLEEQAKKEAAEKKSSKKRKSKKCRDFEKAVKEGKIKLEPNMRNPSTPGGWPGWPGNLTKVSIINYVSTRKNNQFGRGGNASFNKTSRGRGGSFRGSRGRGFSGSDRGSRGGRKPF